MTTKERTTLTKDVANKKIFVSRQFDAPKTKVWEAWTTSSLLDKWWAPKPYKAITKSMDFREGGTWLYKMEGPDGNGMWARLDYKKIEPKNYYIALDAFCDENGNINTEFSRMNWKNTFVDKGNATSVEIEITFDKIEDLRPWGILLGDELPEQTGKMFNYNKILKSRRKDIVNKKDL